MPVRLLDVLVGSSFGIIILCAGWMPRPRWSCMFWEIFSMLLRPVVVAAATAFQMLLLLVLTLLSLPERMPMHLDKVDDGSVADWFAYAAACDYPLTFRRDTEPLLA